MQIDKKTKIVILSAVVIVIVALVVVLALALGKDKPVTTDDGTTSGSVVSKVEEPAQVVSIDESNYNEVVAVMTPTDAVSIVGKWVLTDIITAEGGAADAVAVIGREILTTDTMQFQADGSFSNYIGGIENKDIKAITGMYTVTGANVALTYGDGKTASAVFDTTSQILTVKDGAYSYKLLRSF